MPATLDETLQFDPDQEAQLSPHQKLAVLMLMIGTEGAGQILKGLSEQETEAVTAEMATIRAISQQAQNEVLQEFAGLFIQSATALGGQLEATQAALEKGLGRGRAARILDRALPLRPISPSMQRLAELEPRQLFNLLKHEQPQTIALVSSYLPATKASKMLRHYGDELRQQVVERLATLSPTSPEALERIAAILLQKAGPMESKCLAQRGGLKAAATVLNAFDKRTSQELITSIEERNPELGQAIRQNMFIFEDLERLEQPALQRMLREVDLRDLAIALKRTSEPLRAKLLGCISKRAAETVLEEMSFLNSVKSREVEAAQVRIITTLRRLEAEGEVELFGTEESEKDENLA
jgi:flagellar motor switch protein FliG